MRSKILFFSFSFPGLFLGKGLVIELYFYFIIRQIPQNCQQNFVKSAIFVTASVHFWTYLHLLNKLNAF